LPSLEPLARWFRCPRCGEALTAIGGLVCGCANGHRFDANKRGYLSLLASTRFTGDSPAILDARAAFLALGHYERIADAVANAVPAAAASVIDSGCGTGYYLGAVRSTHPGIDALALDVSPAAVARTVAATGAAGLVADVWSPLPLRDAVTDAITCVFAPRNAPEFARVLTPGGTLVVVTPREEHLQQLRATGRVLQIQQDKLAAVDSALLGQFALSDRAALSYVVSLDVEAQSLVAGMGPAGHHPERATAAAGVLEVTVAVDVSVYTAREPR
jgi:23S rRNA (guanine745-N1)-methyltransferase